MLISDEYTNHAKRRAMMEKRMRKDAGHCGDGADAGARRARRTRTLR